MRAQLLNSLQTDVFLCVSRFVTTCAFFKKYKAFSVFIYSYINTSGIGKTRNCAFFTKYKTFSVLIFSYINTSGIGKTREIVWKFRVFPISTSVDITVYLYRKNVLYFFYSIAMKNTKLLPWMSDGKFSMFILSYVNMALNQLAFKIRKCYII